MPVGSGTPRERILGAATAAFARAGFDGATTREIAAASQLNIATMHHHVGTKDELYEEVFQELNKRESEVLTPLVAAVGRSVRDSKRAMRTAIFDLVDAYLDFLAAVPEVAYLWTRRSLELPAEADRLQLTYGLQIYGELQGQLVQAAAAGTVARTDFHLLLRSFIWMSYGYFTGGLLEQGSGARDPRQPDLLARFRAHVHDTLQRTLELPGAESTETDPTF